MVVRPAGGGQKSQGYKCENGNLSLSVCSDNGRP